MKCTECGIEIPWNTKQCSAECFEDFQWRMKGERVRDATRKEEHDE